MIRLTVATLAALYFILQVFGDEARRPAEVARSEPVALEVVSAVALSKPLDQSAFEPSSISETEAVQLALAAGKALRENREKPRLHGAVLASANSEVTTTTEPVSYWYVTGSRVNLRGGPGTGNAVVGQVTWGTEAEVLSDQNGWYEIRLADGSVEGWIFGKFLNDKLPG